MITPVNGEELEKSKFLSFMDLKWQLFKSSALPLCCENLDRCFQFTQDSKSCLIVRGWEPGGNVRHEIMGDGVKMVH